MPIEKIIHLTVPQRLNALQTEVIEVAKKLHPDWSIMIWQDPLQRDGFTLEHYWEKANSGAQLADLVRLDVVYRFGGVYIDSDLRLLRPLDDLVTSYDFFIASEDGLSLTNAVFGASKGHTVLKSLMNNLLQHEPDWTIPPNHTTGPEFFAEQLKWEKNIVVLPRETFYSYNWNQAQSKSHSLSFGEHLWAHSWGTPVALPTPQRPSLVARIRSALRLQLRNRVKRGLRQLRSLDSENEPKFSSYACADEIVVRTIYGHSIVADGHDLSVTPDLVFNGYYEFAEEAFVKAVVRGGDWVIDVGANIGTLSLLAASCVGSFGRVFSYEPNPRPYGLMSKSLVLNWMHERVVQRPVAVGARAGQVELMSVNSRLGDAQIRDLEPGDSTFDRSADRLGKTSDIQVECRRLDDEFTVDLPIKVLKIDVEGYEAAVLRGAHRLLAARAIDYVMVEMLKEVAGARWDVTLQAVSEVVELGYHPCTLTPAGALRYHDTLAMALHELRGRTLVLASNAANFVSQPRSPDGARV